MTNLQLKSSETQTDVPTIEPIAYKPAEVAKLLGVSIGTVHGMLKDGLLHSKRAGRRHIIPAWSVEKFLKAE